MRAAKIARKTKETDIIVNLNIDGKGKYNIKAPIGFFTHMLESFTKHGLFDIKIKAKGDIEVDQHHTIEDTGIVLGEAFKAALSDKRGINRAGFFAFPMDDALAIVAVDIGGRPYLKYNVKFKRRFCGELDTDLVKEFFSGFTMALGCNAAINMPFGDNDHHKIEAIFKAFAKAMKMACSIDPQAKNNLPSTKGLL